MNHPLGIAAFTDADKNNDGYLSMEEYVRVFHEHGVNITAEEVALYFATKVSNSNCGHWGLCLILQGVSARIS